MYRKYDTSPRSFHFLPTIGSPLLGPGIPKVLGGGHTSPSPGETPSSGMDPIQTSFSSFTANVKSDF